MYKSAFQYMLLLSICSLQGIFVFLYIVDSHSLFGTQSFTGGVFICDNIYCLLQLYLVVGIFIADLVFIIVKTNVYSKDVNPP